MLLNSYKITFNRLIYTSNQIIKMNKQKVERKQRVKIPSIPSNIELVAIGGGKGGTCRSLIVNMTHFKYMFNCGEGTQRIATEHKMLKHTRSIFITSGSWNNIGGLMGLCLTLDSADVKNLQVYGPPQVENYVTTSRNFSKLNGLELVKTEIGNVAYEDTAMNVKFISISNEVKKDLEKKRKLDSSLNIEVAIIYICKPHKKARSISLDLCAKQDLPIGPHLQLLKEGKEVFIPGTDKLIKPDDVLLPEEPSHPFIVLECPSIDYIDDLINNEDLLPYLKQSYSNDEAFTPCAVVHFTPPDVMQDERYQNWIKLFASEVDHLVLNDDSDDLDSEAVHRYQAQLCQLNPIIFPPLYRQTQQLHNINKFSQNIKYMKTNMKYQIRPFALEKFNYTSCLNLNFEEEKDNILKNDDIKQLILELKNDEMNPNNSDQIYPELLFLGTGSAVPNKYRNVSAIWLNLSSDSSMMLDCGENAFGQLYRHLGTSKTLEAIKKLKCVFVSHLHADHHLGVIGLAIARHKLLHKENFKYKPLTLLAPGALLRWYTSIHNSMLPILNYVKIVAVEELIYNTNNEDSDNISQLLDECDLSKISTVRVIHRQCPHGIVIEHKSGWKLVYSGDTMPSNNLIEAGKNCDVLIHEATFDDQKCEEAKDKLHSTSSQAIEVGSRMNAKFTILTHFSQRYDKLPLITPHFTNTIGVAFDNMRVRYCDLKILPRLIPILMLAFKDDYNQMLEVQQHKYHRKTFFESISDDEKSDKKEHSSNF